MSKNSFWVSQNFTLASLIQYLFPKPTGSTEKTVEELHVYICSSPINAKDGQQISSIEDDLVRTKLDEPVIGAIKLYASTGGSPFSIELISHIKTHCLFIHGTRDPISTWFNTEFADATFRAAKDRYLKFTDLAVKYPGPNPAPPWDVDLVWHVCLLNPVSYHLTNYGQIGTGPDHDVSTAGTDTQLDAALATAVLWQKEFGQPYTACLCYECVVQRSRDEVTELPRITALD
jgi:hypothetical protein